MATKKPVNDDLGKEVGSTDNGSIYYEKGAIFSEKDVAVVRAVNQLIDAQLVTVDIDNNITWRTGHLEHIANLYRGDPQATERDYADDLAVARAYSRDVWEGLIGG